MNKGEFFNNEMKLVQQWKVSLLQRRADENTGIEIQSKARGSARGDLHLFQTLALDRHRQSLYSLDPRPDNRTARHHPHIPHRAYVPDVNPNEPMRGGACKETSAANFMPPRQSARRAERSGAARANCMRLETPPRPAPPPS